MRFAQPADSGSNPPTGVSDQIGNHVGIEKIAGGHGEGSNFRSVQRKLPGIHIRKFVLERLKLAESFQKPPLDNGLHDEMFAFPAKKNCLAFKLKLLRNANSLIGPIAK